MEGENFMDVIKRDGSLQSFDSFKIVNAINKAS
jgi:transcriptional regulator NrdR family protein